MADWLIQAIAWTEMHPGAAAWVQAILSIIAVFIAIYVPYRQHVNDVTLARRLRIEDRLRNMEAAAGIVINAMNLIEGAWKGTAEVNDTIVYVDMVYDPSGFDFAASALEEINLANVPDGELIRPIISMRNLIVDAKHLPPAIGEADHYDEHDPDELRERLRWVREEAHRHTATMEAAVNRLRDEASS